MRSTTAVLAAAFSLWACQPPDEGGRAPAEGRTAPTVATEPTPVQTDAAAGQPAVHRQPLAVGEYRVAGADGADIDLPHAITVSVTADTIAVTSQCVTPRWTYRYEDGRLRTEPIVEPICDRGRYPAEEALSAVFDDPREITRTSANGIRIAGGGRSVTLFSQ